MVKYGAYDPLYPNGIMSVSSRGELFGIRFLAYSKKEKKLQDATDFDFRKIRIGKMTPEKFYEIEWEAFGEKIKLTWARISDTGIAGRVDMGEKVAVLAEMYVPREYCLQKEWVNFTKQSEKCVAGEIISPWKDGQNHAVYLTLDSIPVEELGYNNRKEQLVDFSSSGVLRNINEPSIWNDMGLSSHYGLLMEGVFCFTLENGLAQDFLKGFSETESLEKIRIGQISIQEARKRQEAESLRGTGMTGDICEAFSSLLSYNTIYKETTQRKYIMVDRPWTRKEDSWGIQFNWDTFLSSWSSAWVYPELAKENMLSGYDAQLPDGKIPLYTTPRSELRAEPPITAGRAQHIVQGLTLGKTYLRTKDKKWAEQCYEGAKKANQWWFSDRGDGQAYRDALGWGLLGFGYDPEKEMGFLGTKAQPYVAKAQYAYFETYDDSPQWTTGKYFVSIAGLENLTEDTVEDESRYLLQYHMADIYTLERSCLYAVDCESLSKMALALGKPDEADEYRKKYEKMAEMINTRMWCEEDGCYYNLKFDGTFSRKQSPDCFMPLMTGLVPGDRREKLLKLLLDEKKFWGDYMIPSISRDDPAFIQQHYWRGQIWPPQTLWTYLALKRAEEDKIAWEFAKKAASMLAKEWKENGFTPENYHAVTGECSGSPHYNWGVLMGLPLLEELVEFEENEIIFGNFWADEDIELWNIPADNHKYGMIIHNGETEVYRDGKLIRKGEGKIKIKRNE